MDKADQTHAPGHAAEQRATTPARQPDVAPPADVRPEQIFLTARPGTPPSRMWRLAPVQHRQGILGLQRSVGNTAVQQLLGQRRPAAAPVEVLLGVEQTGPDQVAMAAQECELAVGLPADHGLLAKAGIAVRAGTRSTKKLKPNEYGLTYPERVDVTITARLDRKTGKWSPKVTRLTGHYSTQTSLLLGQSEITGPGRNSTRATFCAQVTNLKSLGMTSGNKWYMINAVVQHEKVHAKRFLPALKVAAAAITAKIEKITIPHSAKMTRAKAIAKLQADATYKSEVANAQKLWLAAIFTQTASEHVSGGPTDKAEQKVTEPMRKKICSHAKKKKWVACPACR